MGEDEADTDTGEWQLDDKDESFAPTDWDLVKAFRENHLSVSENKDTAECLR
ncbi:hypothetical protein [Marinobacter sp.]|uniref:hypothetical protein n=1 Tax=Marinobacter sp. TaxID=50741 RepID=UPI003A8E4D32